ncbi:hypothetical protein C0J52_18027 [Blattella germanica]|nr:hypothetical protein C0J52_18027 [Blattella germanica]
MSHSRIFLKQVGTTFFNCTMCGKILPNIHFSKNKYMNFCFATSASTSFLTTSGKEIKSVNIASVHTSTDHSVVTLHAFPFTESA